MIQAPSDRYLRYLLASLSKDDRNEAVFARTALLIMILNVNV